MPTHDQIIAAASDILRRPSPPLDAAEARRFAQSWIERRHEFLATARMAGSPLYVLDEAAILRRAGEFLATFRAEASDCRAYFAIKSNNCPDVAAAMLKAGLGLDVSSGLELEMALSLGAQDIVFSGPAKTGAELALAAAHADRVTVLMDSFAELDRLQAAAREAGATTRAGLRLTTDERGLWRKFGLPLADMPAFFAAAMQRPNVDLRGVQFHTSWNMDATAQEEFIARLGRALAGMAPELRGRVEFVDVGGGYWPPAGEWLHATATPEGRLSEVVSPSGRPPLGHFRFPAAPLADFARRIAAAVKTHLSPHAPCRLHLEPGRWVCHEGMHILLTVLDLKGDDIAITDAGANAIGWERYESDYFPVINLTRPSLDEKPFYVLGSLCTPHDVWGYFYFGEDIRPGDTLLIPCQGAYTYSLRQNFIKPLPKVARLAAGGG